MGGYTVRERETQIQGGIDIQRLKEREKVRERGRGRNKLR